MTALVAQRGVLWSPHDQNTPGSRKGRRRAVAIVLAAALAVPALTAVTASGAAPAGAAVPTATELQPLRALAAALQSAGSRDAGYADVELDAAQSRLVLYATSPAAAHAITAAARAAHPGLAWSAVVDRHAAFGRARLQAAAGRLIRDLPGLEQVAVSPTGTGLTATVAGAPGVRSEVTTGAVRAVGVPVRVTLGSPEQAKSWGAEKWEDSAPFIGGDVLTSDGHHFCSAGLPTLTTYSHVQVLITAAHCFRVGTRVYTGAGTPGDYGNGRIGHYVGRVLSRNEASDSEMIVGEANNADESDRTGWKRLTSAANSVVGDYVCQDGAYSYYAGHPTPCGIKVTDDDVMWKIDGYWVDGTQGVDVLHGWGSHDGDSGGVVFGLEPGNVRQARGLVSSGGADGTPEQKVVDWVQAPAILSAFSLELNPQT